MSTATLLIQRTNETGTIGSMSAALKKALDRVFSKQPDELDDFLSQSQSHDDYAIRLRALQEQEARTCALVQAL